RPDVEHDRQQQNIPRILASPLAKETPQRRDVVRFGATCFSHAFLDLFVQQRLLLLSYANRILPQACVDVLRSNHWSTLFARNRRAFAYEWLVLRDDASEHRQKRQQGSPR